MKKTFAIVLVFMMLLTLGACGSRKNTSSSEFAESSAAEITEESVSEIYEDVQDTQPDESTAADTVGQRLLQDFRSRAEANAALSAQEHAEALLANKIVQFDGAAVPVEEGLLTGFGNAEITGFQEGVMFAPMIGTIPFVGYIFVLKDGMDGDAFVKTLEDNANPRWNICTEADETIAESVGNTVFFLMCPSQFEE